MLKTESQKLALTAKQKQLYRTKHNKFLQEAIMTSLKYKVVAVEKDEKDLKGVREALNFGHTLGHALEAHTKFEYFQHGEAILWGMIFAVHLSHELNFLNIKNRDTILSLLESIPLPDLPKNLQWIEMSPYIQKDKKNKGGRIRFVLLTQIGKSLSCLDVKEEALIKTWKIFIERYQKI